MDQAMPEVSQALACLSLALIFYLRITATFSGLTLLVERQEEHPAGKN